MTTFKKDSLGYKYINPKWPWVNRTINTTNTPTNECTYHAYLLMFTVVYYVVLTTILCFPIMVTEFTIGYFTDYNYSGISIFPDIVTSFLMVGISVSLFIIMAILMIGGFLCVCVLVGITLGLLGIILGVITLITSGEFNVKIPTTYITNGVSSFLGRFKKLCKPITWED